MRRRFEAVLEVVRRSASGMRFQDRMAAIEEALAKLLPLHSLAVTVVNDGPAGFDPDLTYAAFGAPAVREYVEHYHVFDPLLPVIRRATGGMHVLTDRLPRSKFSGNGFAGEFLKRLGIANGIGAGHRYPDGRLLLLGIHLGTKRDFSRPERTVLAALSRDLARAAFEPAAILPANALGAGLLRFDAAGDLTSIDVSARAILERSRAGNPYALLLGAAKRLVGREAPPLSTETVLVPLVRGDQVRVQLVKLDRRSGQGALGVVAPSGILPGSPLKEAGLTARECDVAELAIKGLSNAAVGRALGIGADAVKWHMKNLFKKLGVSSRAELVAALLGAL